MFPSRQRYRHTATYATYQRESSPPPVGDGADSCFGVQSMSSDWGEGSVGSDIPQSGLSLSLSADDAERSVTRARDGEPLEDGQVGANADEEEEEEEEIEGEGEQGLVGLGITPTPPPFQWPMPMTVPVGPTSDSGIASTSDSQVDVTDASDNPSQSHTHAHTRIIPPSPEDTVHPLQLQDRGTGSTIGGNGGSSNNIPDHDRDNDDGPHPLTVSHLDSPYNYANHGIGSEPSSPASFTSMPSYVASLSSLSRTSSVSPYEHDAHAHAHPHAPAHHHIMSAAAGEDLVLPTLSLPSESLSLHMSLRKWADAAEQSVDVGETRTQQAGTGTREQEGIKVLLLGGRERTEQLLRALKDKCDLVELNRGVVGVVEGDKVVLRVITGLSAEQAKERVEGVYCALNRLLHPDLPAGLGADNELRALVSAYAARSDWVHQVVVLEGDADQSILADMIPIMSVSVEARARESTLDAHPTRREDRGEIEPTPRPAEDVMGSYFAPRALASSPTSSVPSSPKDEEYRAEPKPPAAKAADALLALAEKRNQPDCISRSTDAFLSWRQCQRNSTVEDIAAEPYLASPDVSGKEFEAPKSTHGNGTMASSYTSASTAASSSSYGLGGVGPMPTVARAQGGGEWEATLSRRIAQRRESDQFHSHLHAHSHFLAQPSHLAPRGGLYPPRPRGKGNATSLGAAAGAGAGTGAGNRGRRRRSFEREREREREREKEKEKGRSAPLFPPARPTDKTSLPSSSPIPLFPNVGLGKIGLLEKTFRGVRAGTRGWRGVVLACAVAVAVGWGCWISRR